jgi:hypothetical protein
MLLGEFLFVKFKQALVFSDNGKKVKCFPLAPIEVKILPIFFREIATDSGTNANQKRPNVFASKSSRRK